MKNSSHKNMFLFLIGKLISLFGTNIYNFAMSLYILKVTGSAFLFSISMLFSILPRVIFGPVAGVMADKLDRRRTILFCDFLSGILMLLIFIISGLFGLKIWMIYISTICLSITNTFFDITLNASLPNLVDDDKFIKIQSLNQSIVQISSILGTALGGCIYALISPSKFMLINGMSFIASAIMELFIDFKWKLVDDKKNTSTYINMNNNSKLIKIIKGFFYDFKAGFNYLKTKKVIITIITSNVGLNFFFSAIGIITPYILITELLINEKSYGIIESAFTIGALVLSLILAYRKDINLRVDKMFFYIFLFSFCILAISLPIMPGVSMSSFMITIYYSTIYFFMGLLLTLINIPFTVYMQKNTENQFRGRVMSFFSTLSLSITPIGILVHGLLIEYIVSYVIIIYLFISVMLIAFFLNQSLRKIEIVNKKEE